MHSPSKRPKQPRSGKDALRRKLFSTAPSDSSMAAPGSSPGVSCPWPDDACKPGEMDPLDSACADLTAELLAGEVEGPTTPVGQSDGSPRTALDSPLELFTSLEGPLVHALQTWGRQLSQLQPLVKLGDKVLLGALALMREFTAARPDLAPSLQTSKPHLFTYLAAALWLVAKLCGTRTQIPNRSLMSQATQVHPQALSDYELDLLFSLDWNVAAMLRQHDLLA